MSDRLTPRETEVARLVGEGLSYKRIAREMDVSTQTVQVHAQNAASKIEGPGSPRYRLIRWALTEDGESARR